MDRYPIASTATLYLTIDSSGVGVTGESPVAIVQRVSDGYFYDDALASGSRFTATFASNAMVEVDATNQAGLYSYGFDHSEDSDGTELFLVRLMNSGGNAKLADSSIAFGRLQSAETPSLCSVYGTVLDANGQPDINKKVRLSAIYNTVLTTGAKPAVSVDKIDTFTDSQGMFAINVLRGVTARLQISSAGYDKRVVIPDAASANFADL